MSKDLFKNMAVAGRQIHPINDAVKIGSWEEVDGIPASTITKNENDTEKLHGMIVRGYETKFGKVNENLEKYDKDCLDDFFERYYIANKLNIPVTVQHRGDMYHLVGRVLLCEVNTVGFYFVLYIPSALDEYAAVAARIKEGLLQGMSKEGYSEEWEPHFNDKTGEFEYATIKKMDVLAISLVSTPANGVPFEKVQEIRNALTFRKNAKEDIKAATADPFAVMFNH